MSWKKNITIGITLFLVIGIATLVILFKIILSPSITIHEKEGSIFVDNVFLGEYYLGFTEVTITDQVTGKKLFHALKNDGKEIIPIEFSSNVNLAEEFKKNGWEVTEPYGSCSLKSGQLYHLFLSGNNGSGGLYNKNIEIKIP